MVVVNAILVEESSEFDDAAFRFFNGLASDQFYCVTQFISFLGTTRFLLLAFMAMLLYFILTKQ